MVLHRVWPPRCHSRRVVASTMRLMSSLVSWLRARGRSLAPGGGWGPQLLLVVAAAVALLTILLLMASQDASVHIECPCQGEALTGVRVARHIGAIMREQDPATGRSALDSIRMEHPFLAVDFLLAQELRGWRCPLVPGLFSVRHNNGLWQEARVGGTTFLLYSAYYDDRDTHKGPLIRILSVADSSRPPTPTCHLYPAGELAPVATKALSVDFIHWQYPLSGEWLPYLITCQTAGLSSSAVSVVGHACEAATNALLVANTPPEEQWMLKQKRTLTGEQVRKETDRSLQNLHGKNNASYEIYHHSERLPVMDKDAEQIKHSRSYRSRNNHFHPVKRKKNLALCHKFLYNKLRDDSVRLTEWLEAARAWGVDDVTLYLSATHPNVEKVLQHYQQQGFVTVVPWSNPGHHPNVDSLQRALYDTQRYALFTLENIPYTDCLLRHIYTHRYVAVWDMDEFILPAPSFTSLPQMVDAAKLKWHQAHTQHCGKVNLTNDNIEAQSYNRGDRFVERNKYKSEDGSMLEEAQHIIGDADFADHVKTMILNPSFDGIKGASDRLMCKPPVSYLARCSYFFDDLSEPENETNKHLHMMRHVTRTVKFTQIKVHTKAIHDTSRALALHAHFALYSSDGPVQRHTQLYHLYPSSEGYLGHYRSKCQGENQTECDTLFRPYLERDERMLLHRRQVASGANATLALLGLL